MLVWGHGEAWKWKYEVKEGDEELERLSVGADVRLATRATRPTRPCSASGRLQYLSRWRCLAEILDIVRLLPPLFNCSP